MVLQMKNWVSTEILKGETPQERGQLIELFIQVAMVTISDKMFDSRCC
jgi:hypothetical protein